MIRDVWIFIEWIHVHLLYIYRKMVSVSKVFVECIIGFGEVEEVFLILILIFVSWSAPFTCEVSPNTTRRLNKARIGSFKHFDTKGSP